MVNPSFESIHKKFIDEMNRSVVLKPKTEQETLNELYMTKKELEHLKRQLQKDIERQLQKDIDVDEGMIDEKKVHDLFSQPILIPKNVAKAPSDGMCYNFDFPCYIGTERRSDKNPLMKAVNICWRDNDAFSQKEVLNGINLWYNSRVWKDDLFELRTKDRTGSKAVNRYDLKIVLFNWYADKESRNVRMYGTPLFVRMQIQSSIANVGEWINTNGYFYFTGEAELNDKIPNISAFKVDSLCYHNIEDSFVQTVMKD